MINDKLIKKRMTDYVLIRDLLEKRGEPEKDGALCEKVLDNELTFSNRPSLLTKAYLLTKEKIPEKSKWYKELKTAGLKYIDDYIALNRKS